jgi:hypothetical protein
MAKHILRIVFSKDELNSLPQDTFQQNQAVFGYVPVNPLSSLWTPGTSIIRESQDWNKDRNFKQRLVPFSVLADSYLNSKDSLNIFIEGR